jgi:AcrR family transcriptional regulator
MKDGEGRQRRRTRAESKADTREKLLRAAARIFARRGFAGASVEEIAAEAGYSIGALYANFGSKAELFVELMTSQAHRHIESASALLRSSSALLDVDASAAAGTGTALGQMMVDVADNGLDLVGLQSEFFLYALRNPEVMEAFAERQRAPLAALQAVLALRLQDNGVEVPDEVVEQLAIVVFALFSGMVRQRCVSPASAPAELYGKALRWLFTGVRQTENLSPPVGGTNE